MADTSIVDPSKITIMALIALFKESHAISHARANRPYFPYVTYARGQLISANPSFHLNDESALIILRYWHDVGLVWSLDELFVNTYLTIDGARAINDCLSGERADLAGYRDFHERIKLLIELYDQWVEMIAGLLLGMADSEDVEAAKLMAEDVVEWCLEHYISPMEMARAVPHHGDSRVVDMNTALIYIMSKLGKQTPG